MAIELNTLAPKKWVDNYAGATPTIDTTDGVRVGDFAIDTSNDAVWQCKDDTDTAPVWVLSNTPSGSSGEIQFNNSGSLGANSSLYVDGTNNNLYSVRKGGGSSAVSTTTTTGTTFLGYLGNFSNAMSSVAAYGSLMTGSADVADSMYVSGTGAFVGGRSATGGASKGIRGYNSDASFIFGSASASGLLTNNGTGNWAGGNSSNYGVIKPYGYGNLCFGRADGGYIYSGDSGSDKGNFASGYAGTTCTIIASGNGSRAHGFGVAGDIRATGEGAVAMGRVYSPSNNYIDILASGRGSIAMGNAYSYNNYVSALQATGHGAVALGYAHAYSYAANIQASAAGALAVGYAKNNTIVASGQGSVAIGYSTGTLLASYDGAVAMGWCGSGSYLRATAKGAFAGGYADVAGVNSSGVGSFAFGRSNNNVYGISSSGSGSVAFGYSASYDILSSGNGSLAIGYATGADISAGASNSFQFGPGTNNTSDSLQVGTGIHIHGAGVPSPADDGDIWVANNKIYVHTNGTTTDIGATVVTVSTTTATPAVLTKDGGAAGAGNSIVIPSDTTWGFNISVVARRTDADNESAFYKFEGCIDNNAGTTALVGTPVKTIIAEDTAAWDVTITANNTLNSLVITATGEASKTISWKAKVEIIEITG